jgi:catalase
MNIDEPAGRPKPPARNPITRRSALVGVAVVAGVAAVDVGGFAYAGGWLRPDDLTPSRVTDGFERVYGRHDGFRRNHAKGVSASGFFTSSGAAAEICRAAVFAPGAVVPVIGRFSLSGGVPDQADKAATVRGLGLQFDPPGGRQWRTAMINLPVFPDRTPQGFYERLLASKPDPDTGKPDPDAMAAFLQRHPETVAAMKVIKASPPTPGFADSTYHSLNAFHFTNRAGTTVPVRWTAVPTQEQPSPTATPPGRDDLFDALIGAASRGPLTWRLVIALGAPTDPLDDATLPWPADRPTIDAGTITVAALHTEAPGNARDINFDPLVLPEGITPSADPLLSARSAVYARSYTRRAGEPKQPSAVTVGQVAS